MNDRELLAYILGFLDNVQETTENHSKYVFDGHEIDDLRDRVRVQLNFKALDD